jgi:hypothetical protein
MQMNQNKMRLNMPSSMHRRMAAWREPAIGLFYKVDRDSNRIIAYTHIQLPKQHAAQANGSGLE